MKLWKHIETYKNHPQKHWYQMNWVCCYLSQVKRKSLMLDTQDPRRGSNVSIGCCMDHTRPIATYCYLYFAPVHLPNLQEWKLKLCLCLLQYWQPMTVMTANALHTIEAPLLVGCCEVLVLLKPNHHLFVRLTCLSKELAETSLVLWLDEWAFTSWPRILCLVEMPMWMCLYTKMFEASALHNLPGMLLTLPLPRIAKIQSTFRNVWSSLRRRPTLNQANVLNAGNCLVIVIPEWHLFH